MPQIDYKVHNIESEEKRSVSFTRKRETGSNAMVTKPPPARSPLLTPRAAYSARARSRGPGSGCQAKQLSVHHLTKTQDKT